MLSEDKVRELAGKTLGFYDSNEAQSGIGQITTFNQLDKAY